MIDRDHDDDDSTPKDLFGHPVSVRKGRAVVAQGRPIGDRLAERLAAGAGRIASTSPAPQAGEVVYQHTVLCQCGLPYRPTTETRWERQIGRVSLLLQAGEVQSPASGQFEKVALPHGEKPRLVLMHLNAEAIRTQSPVIEVEESMTAFVRSLGLDTNGRQIRTIKTQLGRLAVTTIRFAMVEGQHVQQINTNVVGAFDLWFPQTASQRVLWPTTVRLSDDYFQSLLGHAVPLDRRAIANLSGSALALDVYSWLAQRLHTLPREKPTLITWKALAAQFGQEYDRLRAFRARFMETLQRVQTQYPAARLEATPAGLVLRNSPPPVLATMSRGVGRLRAV